MKKPNIDITPYVKKLNTVVGKYYRWFVLIMAIAILGIGWLVLLQGQYNQVRTDGLITFQQTQQELQDRQQYLTQLRQMDAAYSALHTERLTQVERTLPVGVDKTKLIAQMESFANAVGMDILGVDVTLGGEAASGTSDESVKFSSNRVQTAIISLNLVGAESSYDDLKAFLDALESFVPVLDLRSVSFTPETTSFALQLYTYYLEESTVK